MAKLPPAVQQEIDTFRKNYPSTRYVDAVFSDLCGIIRGKRFSIDSLEKLYEPGLRFPGSVFLLDVTGANHDPVGHGFTDGDPDHRAMAIPGTLKPVPWSKTDLVQVYLSFHHEDLSPYHHDPRNILRKVADRFKAETGLNPVSAVELEFYLIDRERGPDGEPQPPLSPTTGKRDLSTQVYGINQLTAFEDFIQDIEKAGAIQGIDIGGALAEYAPGQFEVNLNHVDDVVEAGDQAALFKRLVTGIAAKHGVEATFMAKPYTDQAGSGMHIHVSALDDNGQNVFDDGTREGSQLLKHAVGGMMAVMPEAMAFTAPNPNSYRRFIPNIFVPMRPSWGTENRAVAIRIPGGESKARRAEFRSPGADANAYLVLACLLAGMMHGIKHQIEPGEMADAQLAGTPHPDMPLRPYQALERLDRAEILHEYLTPEYCNVYKECKMTEFDSYFGAITRREYEWYMLTDG
jgi:glutamine synthetase